MGRINFVHVSNYRCFTIIIDFTDIQAKNILKRLQVLVMLACARFLVIRNALQEPSGMNAKRTATIK